MAEHLSRLPPRHAGVVTGKIQYQAEHVVESVGLRPLLRSVHGWSPGLAPKPAPDVLVNALEAIGARPEEAVYVGDTAGDVLAGRAAGLETVAVTWGFGSEDDLAGARPGHVARSVEELASILLGGEARQH